MTVEDDNTELSAGVRTGYSVTVPEPDLQFLGFLLVIPFPFFSYLEPGCCPLFLSYLQTQFNSCRKIC